LLVDREHCDVGARLADVVVDRCQVAAVLVAGVEGLMLVRVTPWKARTWDRTGLSWASPVRVSSHLSDPGRAVRSRARSSTGADGGV
jgi:hypothetical protein